MNFLYMTLSSLSQKHACGLQNLTVEAGMQRERDQVQFLTFKLAGYLRNDSQPQETAEHCLLFQEAAWETSQGLQAIGAT